MNEHSATAGRKNLAQNQARGGDGLPPERQPALSSLLWPRADVQDGNEIPKGVSPEPEVGIVLSGWRPTRLPVSCDWKITCSSMRTGVNRTFNKYNRQGYSAAGSPAVREYKLGFSPSCSSSTPEVTTTGRLHELQLKWVAGVFGVILREICWGEV